MTSQFLRAVVRRRQFIAYPNGEFSVTPQREQKEDYSAPPIPENGYSPEGEWIGGHCESFKKDYIQMLGREKSALGSSNVSNCVSPTKRGLQGFTRHQKRLARNGCLLLERDHHKSTLCFLTLTLPPAVANASSQGFKHAVKVFYKWLSRRLGSARLDDRWVSVSEVQEKRLITHEQFALHEHVVFQGRTRYRPWAVAIEEFQDAWNRALEAGYGIVIPEDQKKNSIDVEGVRKSAAAYLGKYMSKGVATVKALIEKGHAERLPSTWVHRSKSMLQSYRAAIVKLSGERCERLMKLIEQDWILHVRWFQDIVIKTGDGHEIAWGRAGYLTPAGQSLIASALAQEG
jgi:hypothetical protein